MKEIEKKEIYIKPVAFIFRLGKMRDISLSFSGEEAFDEYIEGDDYDIEDYWWEY